MQTLLLILHNILKQRFIVCRMPFWSNAGRFYGFRTIDIQPPGPVCFIASMGEPAKEWIVQHLIDGLEPLGLLSLSDITLHLVPLNVGPECLRSLMLIRFIVFIDWYIVGCSILRYRLVPTAFINTILHIWAIMIFLAQAHFIFSLPKIPHIWLKIRSELFQTLVVPEIDVSLCYLFAVELQYLLKMCILPAEDTAVLRALGFAWGQYAIFQWQVRLLQFIHGNFKGAILFLRKRSEMTLERFIG